MKRENSIAKGYQVLDAKLLLQKDENEINETFTFIVNNAFDKLSDKLISHEKFDMNDLESIATARAIYEYGIQRYSESDLKSAKDIFLVLHKYIDDTEISDAMMVHAVSISIGKNFEEFIATMVDNENIDINDDKAFFIKNFTQPVDILLTMFADNVKECQMELSKLDKKG